MNLTDDDVLKFQRGTPIFLEDVCAIYSLKVGEVVDLGYSNFEKFLGLLIMTKPVTLNDKELEKIIEDLTDFQYFLILTAIDKEVNKDAREAFRIFIREDVSFSLDPPQIVVGQIEEKRIINEEMFYDLQKVLRRMYFIEQESEEIIIYADDEPAVRRLKKQMIKNRERVRKSKAKKAAREKTDLKTSDLIGSITINDCGLNMENIWNITYYALQDQLKRMGWRDQFDINNKAALAGAKINKNQLKHWMRSIADSKKT